ncbi:MAG: hypothetical protein KAI83_03910 [Thiomargarita sp.]|nr:hypothetical protein [Thiomargarita sp.]
MVRAFFPSSPRSQAPAWERIQGRSASRDAERRDRRSQARAWERGVNAIKLSLGVHSRF